MKYVGAHVSVEGGVSKAPLNARAIGAEAFALFTRNPSRWKSKEISDKEAEAFKKNCEECGYTPAQILPHDSYLINLGQADAAKLAQSREAFLDEFRRCEQLGLCYFLGPDVPVGSLENERNAFHALVLHEHREKSVTYGSLAEALMAVHT